MNTTSLHVKMDEEDKRQAQETAEELGLSLSAVVKAFLKQFVRTKRLSVSSADLPEIPNARTRRLLKQAEEDMRGGRGISFASAKEAIAYLDKEIADEKNATH